MGSGVEAAKVPSVNLAGAMLPNMVLSASQTEVGEIRLSVRDHGGMEVSLILDSHSVGILSRFVRDLEEALNSCCTFVFTGFQEGVGATDTEALWVFCGVLQRSHSEVLYPEVDAIIENLRKGIAQDVQFSRPPSEISLSRLRDFFVFEPKG
jgi:hypothetical protein